METRFHYTIRQKLYILDLVNNGSIMELERDFPNVTQKMINEWQQKEDRMRVLPLAEQRRRYTLHSGPSQKYEELFQYLYQIVKILRFDRRAVSVNYLMAIAHGEDAKFRSMTSAGKKSLIRRFLEHFNLSIRAITGYSGYTVEQLPEEQMNQIEQFKAEYNRLIQDYNIPSENIFNMDQTGVLYENPTARTIDFSGVREVNVRTQGNEKKRITVISLINAAGELFPQMLIFKGVREKYVHAEVSTYDDLSTMHTVQENAWTDADVLIEWDVRLWSHITSERDGHKLLILDAYPLHKNMEMFLSRNDTHILYVPKGMTWSLQPLDCGFFKVFKDKIRNDWLMNQQYKEYPDESAKREALSTILKSIFYELLDQSHTAYWEKAGLSYPEDLMIREENQEVVPADTGMDIEGDDNLFAE